jgi:hypothetical protein|tara:strand:+ start:1234 stop:1590 length:357 start_codon:yes stop_codon:yes gene_type:complete
MNNTTSDTDNLIDTLIGSQELMLLAVLALGLGAMTWLYVPQFRFFAMKLIGKYDDEILELYEKNLTPLMREKLTKVAEKHVKDEILKQVILSTFDHTEDKAQGTVKKLIRDISKEAKK